MKRDDVVFRVLFPFCGLGAGALGFVESRAEVGPRKLRFQAIGGIDIDPAACADFEYLTGAPSWCVDIATLRPEDLRARYGEAPDCVFGSPPCKGASGLLSQAKSRDPKYQAMNELALVWVRLMLGAWPERPPRLFLLENVPRLATRAPAMLLQVRALLRGAGYVLHEGYHDCGELGGLAQHRRRFLLVARHEDDCPQLLYQPPKQRVRACGEVLQTLPVPATPEAERYGRLHEMPRISWLNWVRLALIPAGGDWRDLDGVLRDGQRRGEQWKRHEVSDWNEPTGVVSGSGSNAVANVADPRVEFAGRHGVLPWDKPAGTVTGGMEGPSNGASSVADPRVDAMARRLWEQKGIKTPGQIHWFKGKYGVNGWNEPSRTVIGGPSNGAAAVADPRGPDWFKHVLRVRDWDEPAGAVTSSPSPSSGAQAAADPRVEWFHGAYGVRPWDGPGPTVTGNGHPATGRFAVADPRAERFRGTFGVVSWEEAMGTITGDARPSKGSFAVADPRLSCRPRERSHASGVTPWEEPSLAVTGSMQIDNGQAAVADPRVKRAYDAGYAVLDWEQAARTIAGGSAVGQGAYAVADPRVKSANPNRHHAKYRVEDWEAPAHTVTGATRPGSGAPAISDPRKPPPFLPVIIAKDGTWHRPMTTLELAVLQGIPHEHCGAPLRLAGTSQSKWRERIGNAVPVGAARAIATRMLVTLGYAALGMFALDGQHDVWVVPDGRPVDGLMLMETRQ